MKQNLKERLDLITKECKCVGHRHQRLDALERESKAQALIEKQERDKYYIDREREIQEIRDQNARPQFRCDKYFSSIGFHVKENS